MLKYSWGAKRDGGKVQCAMAWTDRRSGSTVTFDVTAEHIPDEAEHKTDSRLRGQALKLAKAFLADQDVMDTDPPRGESL